MISTDYNSINLGNTIFKISESRQKVVKHNLIEEAFKMKVKVKDFWKIAREMLRSNIMFSLTRK